MDLNELSKDIHNGNVQRGFYEDKKETGTLLMLVVSELAEALEADRNGKFSDTYNYKNETVYDDEKQLFENNPFVASQFKEHIKDTFEDEIADTLIRLLDLCGFMNIDIDFHVREKLKYNATRPRKHGKEY